MSRDTTVHTRLHVRPAKLRSVRSDLSLFCSPEEALDLWLPIY